MVSLAELINQNGGKANPCQGKSLYSPLELAQAKAAQYNRAEANKPISPEYTCKKCKNKGYIMIAHEDGSTSIAECTCMAARKSLEILKKSGLENMVKKYKFSSYITNEEWQRKALEIARDYANNPDGRWLIASGEPGSGKTHLCTAVCRELMLKGVPVRYALWVDISKRLKACITDEPEYFRRINRLKTVKVLYLDDFLKTKNKAEPTAGDVNLAFEIINSRYNNNLATIISTEWFADELMEIDSALGSRIWELTKNGSSISFRGHEKNWRMK
jgi:DNA replication protein DnaC